MIGPVEVPSLGGALYITTLLDDKTGYAVVGIYDAKSHAAPWLKARIEEWQRQTSKMAKHTRSDRGKEYLGDFEAYLKRKGILHETSAAYTPQQNGRAECSINRSLRKRPP
jgi:transposase InsO family protein